MDDEARRVFEALLAAGDQGEACALVTVTATQGSIPRHAGSKMLVRADGSQVGTIGGGALEALAVSEALAALADGQTRTPVHHLNNLEHGDPGICGGSVTLFIEPIIPAPTLLVVGGGHVGKALAELGLWAGFRVILNDDRAEYCSPDYVPGLAGYVVCAPGELVSRVSVGPHTYVAAVTRGLPVDLDLIPALLATPAPYIGVIGSKRRWRLTVEALRDQRGLTDAALARIHAPIGLELEAETPKEIAISILAEIIMIRRGGTGYSMKEG